MHCDIHNNKLSFLHYAVSYVYIVLYNLDLVTLIQDIMNLHNQQWSDVISYLDSSTVLILDLIHV